jgi:hypothetical protein
MTDIRFPVSGNIRYWFVPAGGIAVEGAPTEAEIAAGLDISDAISWNDKDFGVQPSNTVEDPAITAKGKVQDRGAAQYGGGLSLYYPLDRTVTGDIYVQVENALGVPGVKGYLIARVDGSELSTTTGNAAHPGTLAKAGDFVTIYKVETAGYAQSITGEEAFRYTVSFLSKGFVKTFGVVRLNATVVPPVIVGTPGTGAAGTKVAVTGTLIGRSYTRGLTWKSSDNTKATVSRNGIITRKATGTATITATDPATGSVSTGVTVTVT